MHSHSARCRPLWLVLLVGAMPCALAGCATLNRSLPAEQQASGVVYPNPLFIPATDPDFVWETVVDVIDDYFRIEHEEPVRCIAGTITEGRLETFPEVGATVFEPWHGDSANMYQRVESTLQSIRRNAELRVIPAQGGFWFDVAVYKYLENAKQPLTGSAGAATMHYDGSMTRVINPMAEQDPNAGWMRVGRDPALEQRILGRLQSRLSPGASQPPLAPMP